MPAKEDRLPGIEPTNAEEARAFAQRYLTPQLQRDYLEHHRDADETMTWLQATDAALYHEVWMDGICVNSDIALLPYAERLEAVTEERKRFDAWRQRRKEGEHVC